MSETKNYIFLVILKLGSEKYGIFLQAIKNLFFGSSKENSFFRKQNIKKVILCRKREIISFLKY